mmetsp:Transcript_18356/g.24224  ORF Transcript_18356/g.24224 Transcript_18356/m.24224 type:complete len:119 (+) Transcript_18356:126-482(+)|eukprot:CAMPEP_0117760732 /NCGR_PEP_ID=MMETSP0947-20121206/16823_1 /TAXON_ID=44440 /ORGANISM="Chattonella subsalsa, Strain CCMP2191" /LENGTH=118 /DNA_ID=CAMNT_0005581515 /DNA_START=126 /DNA_END=482 /DNA_ORIENTATION=+
MAQQGGIQELMAAEAKASQIVQEARSARTERMKEARIEADVLIEEFKKQKEAAYQAASAKASGSSTTDFSELEQQTARDVENMRNQYQSNADKVIFMMVDKVTGEFPLKIPEARIKKN